MNAESTHSGLLVVDKPAGLSSHDVVNRVRRILKQRSVGHAGTLDPFATGVLLVLVGECTKLSRFLVLEQKSYQASVRLGTATDSFDCHGKVTETQELHSELMDGLSSVCAGSPPCGLLARVVEAERLREMQLPPAFSAIKQAGVPAYARARRGEDVRLEERPVRVFDLQIVQARLAPPELDLEMVVSKGFYVRSLARDMGQRLGVPAHLVALRRTAVGPYTLGAAVSLEQASHLEQSLISLSDVARTTMPCAVLTDSGVIRARHGQRMSHDDFSQPPDGNITVWLDSAGDPVAVGDGSSGLPVVMRVFPRSERVC